MRTFTRFLRKRSILDAEPAAETPEGESPYLMPAAPGSISLERWWTPRDAEDNAVQQMRALGYRDAERTPVNTPDIDVTSSRALGQVKHMAAPVPKSYLARLYGSDGERGKELWYFTPQGYAANAVEYADEKGILLFTYRTTGELESVNRAATVRLAALMGQQLARLQKKLRNYEKRVSTNPAPLGGARMRNLHRLAAAMIAELESAEADEALEISKEIAALEVSYNMS